MGTRPRACGATSVQVLSSLGEIVVAAIWPIGIGRTLRLHWDKCFPLGGRHFDILAVFD